MLIHLYNKEPNHKQVQHIVECLRNGGVIIYPTDTVYGIGCDSANPKAMDRIATIKGKKNALRFSLLCQDLSSLSNYCKPLSNGLFKIMKSVLPGPYTFILEANNLVPKIFFDKKKNVGVRIPDNTILLAIIEELGRPLVNTSIDIPEDDTEYATHPELIHEKYRNLVDIVIDGGEGGLEKSTIIDCTSGEMEVVREGKGSIDFSH